jgi:hypothetical protein
VKLWRVAKFLEDIPSKLPFASHPYKHIMPVNEFSRPDVMIYMTWLLTWYGLGVVFIGQYNLVASGIYLVFGPSAYAMYLYLACTKCPYYGKRCYMVGGRCAKRVFKPRQGDYTLVEDLTVPALWIVISMYPTLFLVYYQSWLPLLAYCVLAVGWQIFHKRNVCSKCLNVRCALNPRFVERTGRS